MIKQNRVRKLAEGLQKRGLDALYIGPSTDLEYIGELDTHPDERVRGLMVAKDGRCFAMTPLLYEEEITKAFGDVPFYSRWDDYEGYVNAFKRGCEHLGVLGGKIAFNDGVRAVDMLTLRDSLGINCFNGADILAEQRAHKDEEELEMLRTAGRTIDKVMEALSHYCKPGLTERDVVKKIHSLLESFGCPQVSFEPIVAVNPNGSMPHYAGDQGVIQQNDLVLIDMGCRYKSYCSDTTRTLIVGTPTEEQKKCYEIVRKAQAAGEATVKPGATGQDVDRAARQVIIDAGYGKYFFNRVGHGVGIAVHEHPYMIEGNTKPLEPGNVFSVEPGIYIAGKFGIRIENLVAVKPDGTAEELNHFPREMVFCDAR